MNTPRPTSGLQQTNKGIVSQGCMPTQCTTPCETPRPIWTNYHFQGFHHVPLQLYCPPVWHFCGATNTKKLERIQFRALRFVFLDFESDNETLLDRAGLPTLELSRKRAILIDVYKNLTHQSPAFLWNSYKPKLINYSLRNANTLCTPHSKTTRYGLQSLTTCGANLWNYLLNNTKSCTDLSHFKSARNDHANVKCVDHKLTFYHVLSMCLLSHVYYAYIMFLLLLIYFFITIYLLLLLYFT